MQVSRVGYVMRYVDALGPYLQMGLRAWDIRCLPSILHTIGSVQFIIYCRYIRMPNAHSNPTSSQQLFSSQVYPHVLVPP